MKRTIGQTLANFLLVAIGTALVVLGLRYLFEVWIHQRPFYIAEHWSYAVVIGVVLALLRGLYQWAYVKK